MRKFLVTLIAGMSLAIGQTTSPNSMNDGIAAFRAARYPEAIQLFKQAASASPADPLAHLYLATAYMTLYIPGADTPENQQFASDAEREFQAALAIQPDNVKAMESLASLHYMRASGSPVLGDKLRSLDESAYWYRKLVAAQPDDKSAYYSLGVIAWAKFYPELMKTRRALGMRPEDPGPIRDPALRADLRSRMSQTVEEGIRSLERALELDPAYADAMAYVNLLHRERADWYDTTAEYQREVAIADSWLGRSLNTKKAKPLQYVSDAQPAPRGTTAGIFGANPSTAPAPQNPPPAAGSSGQLNMAKQIRVGGNVQASKLIEKPEPEYPALARQAGILGKVRYNATILKDGTIGNLTLVSGHPLLVSAATDAARRYRYEPTLLNGELVEVLTQIEVSFPDQR